jgi:multiple sugar transport system substrate-binding protein
MKKRNGLIAAVMSSVLVLAACGGSSAGSATTKAAGSVTTRAAAATTAKASAAATTKAAATSTTAAKAAAGKQVITIWYEGGDARLPFFKSVEAAMQKDYPNYSINAVTFDNNTFMTKVLQAATATGGVDLAFNDASRLLSIDLQSGSGFEDLSSILDGDAKKSLVTDGDKKLSSDNGRLVVYPVNRTIAGLGVKTDVSGVSVTADTKPTTWDKFIALGKAYKAAGKNGFTMILGSDQGQVFNLFMCGSGMQDIFLNKTPESRVAANKKYFEEIAAVYAGADGFWDKDATSEDFTAMYSKITSGSVGMFRAGNWNVAGWDKADSGAGAYDVMTWPALENDGKSGLVLLNTRGFAMPKNSQNKDAARVFLKYALQKDPQTKSFETMGSCLDNSVVDQSKLTKNQKIFFDPNVKLYPIDNYAAEIPYFNDINDVYQKGLTKAVSAKTPEEISKAIADTDADINKVIKQNKK